jgi:hypothetical protein
MNVIAEHLSRLELAAPVACGPLMIYPLLASAVQPPTYLTLDEALAGDRCLVREIGETGSVNRLLFVNKADQPILLLDGDILVGAKQDRVLNLSILAPARGEIEIPVSCVERGRWGFATRRDFRSADSSYSSTLRAMKAASVTQERRSKGMPDANQAVVWDSVNAKLERLGVNSATESAAYLDERLERDSSAQIDRLEPLPRQVGALFALDRRVLGLDLFDSPPTFARVLKRIARGYLVEAFDPWVTPGGAAHDDPRAFLARLCEVPALRYPSVGLGEDVRLGSWDVVGAALLHGRLVHLAAFPQLE